MFELVLQKLCVERTVPKVLVGSLRDQEWGLEEMFPLQGDGVLGSGINAFIRSSRETPNSITCGHSKKVPTKIQEVGCHQKTHPFWYLDLVLHSLQLNKKYSLKTKNKQTKTTNKVVVFCYNTPNEPRWQSYWEKKFRFYFSLFF